MASEAQPFLGVTHSLGGRAWRARLADERAALALAQRLDVPEIVARVLAARGVTLEEAPAYLSPSLRRDLPDPSRLKDMDAAAARLATAISNGEQVAVFGDYDVDGATSSALLWRFFDAVGGKLTIYIPDRLREGYGPNAPALLGLREAGVSVVVTVDCGTLAHEPLAVAADAGLDVIVVDHHMAEPVLPRAFAVINPNRLDEEGLAGELAAVGVAFLLVVAVNRALRTMGWYEDRPEPELMGWLDLVALGTLCDMVPLTGVNRPLVVTGLKVMARRSNLGLTALADVAGMNEAPRGYHAGFVLGPRVNAGGRIGKADLGARLLSTADEEEARRIAAELDVLNRERRAIEAMVLEQASAAAAREDDGGTLVCVAGAGWHPGVVGIVASRLKDRFRRPAAVIALADGIGRGSARSVPGVDLGAAVIAARQAGLLINGGGHPMAAGLTVAEENIPRLADFLRARLVAAVPARAAQSLGIDGALSVAGASLELADLLERAGPFGTANPEPRFAVTNARLVRAEVVGGEHVRCILAGDGSARLQSIAFRSRGEALGEALLAAGTSAYHVAGHLRIDSWRGRHSVRLHIEDAAPATSTAPAAPDTRPGEP